MELIVGFNLLTLCNDHKQDNMLFMYKMYQCYILWVTVTLMQCVILKLSTKSMYVYV